MPLVIADDALTTLTWLKTPLSAPDLARKRIIADCYAALNPSEELWRRYLGEIGRLEARGDITEHDYYLVRYSVDAKAALMDKTLGVASALSTATVQEVVEQARSAARSDLVTTLLNTEERLAEERRSSTQTNWELQRALAAAREAKEAAEHRATSAERVLEVRRQAQTERIRVLASWPARLIARGLFAVVLLVLVLGSVYTAPLGLADLLSDSFGSLTFFAVLVVLTVSIVNIVTGTNLRVVNRQIELKLAGWIEGILARFLPVD